MTWNSKHTFLLSIVILALSCYFSLFHQLQRQPMQLWDESSYALNAQEMIERGDFLRMYLFEKPELYNTKPPFAIWCMAISIKLLGLNELGARLPSALFAFFTAILLFAAVYRYTRNGLFALFPAGVLVSSTGFVDEHIARTGDTDSILAFWILVQCVTIFLYTTNTERSRIYLLLTAFAVTMGCFTKGIAGLTALPGIIAWLLYTKRFSALFKQKEFYIGVVFFLIVVPGYYILRNYLTPGYLKAVFNFEVGGRLWQQEFLNPEKRPFYYYYQSMVTDERLTTWIFILPISIAIIVRSAKSPLQQLGVMLIMALTSVSLLLAMSSTKLFWYDAPLYPLIAGIIGLSFILPTLKITTTSFIWLGLGVACWPFYIITERNIHKPLSSHFPSFIQNIRNAGYEKDSLNVINADPNFPLHFYAKQQLLQGKLLAVIHPMDSALTTGKLIITEKYAREVDVNKRFILDTLAQQDECTLYRIKAHRADH